MKKKKAKTPAAAAPDEKHNYQRLPQLSASSPITPRPRRAVKLPRRKKNPKLTHPASRC